MPWSQGLGRATATAGVGPIADQRSHRPCLPRAGALESQKETHSGPSPRKEPLWRAPEKGGRKLPPTRRRSPHVRFPRQNRQREARSPALLASGTGRSLPRTPGNADNPVEAVEPPFTVWVRCPASTVSSGLTVPSDAPRRATGACTTRGPAAPAALPTRRQAAFKHPA